MEKGYYQFSEQSSPASAIVVAIHNKNGKGLLLYVEGTTNLLVEEVAIHNKNGKGLLLEEREYNGNKFLVSQSTIKMEKGYYRYTVVSCLMFIFCRNPQ